MTPARASPPASVADAADRLVAWPDAEVCLAGRACAGMDTGHATAALCHSATSREIAVERFCRSRRISLATPSRVDCSLNVRHLVILTASSLTRAANWQR